MAMHPSQLISHRGQTRQYPENTLCSIRHAIAAGAQAIEIDLHFSKDKIPVLCHDVDIERLTGISANVHELSWRELQAFHPHEPERLGNTFEHESFACMDDIVHWTLSNAPEVHWFVELKPEIFCVFEIEEIARLMAAALKPLGNKQTQISYDTEYLAHLSNDAHQSTGLILTDWIQCEPDIARLSPEYLFVNKRKVPDNTPLNAIQSKVVIYDCLNASEAEQWLNRGATLVESFDIEGLMAHCTS